MAEPTVIFELSQPGRHGTKVRTAIEPTTETRCLPGNLQREKPLSLPEIDEQTLVRHYVKLSHKNYGVDTGFYPLGSCTMKYNPKVTEAASSLPGFSNVHPTQPASTVQASLHIMHDLQVWLSEICGMDATSLQPAAGAHGEFAGMLIFRKYFAERSENERKVMIVPDSAHGTNPASAHIAGFELCEVDCVNHGGMMTPDLLEGVIEKHGADRIAGIMLTNPSTLGLFEQHIVPVSARLHEIGAQLYYDGANLNALLGIARPGDMGFDLVHLNLHKTFSTPHGGGGPGSGPIGVKGHLAPYLPDPVVELTGDGYSWKASPESIGRMKLYHGQFLVLVRAWAYLCMHGPAELRRIGEHAILNANYVQARLKDAYDVPFDDKPCMHEFVASADGFKEYGIRALDIAKALLNDGFHAPTIYFPLIVHEALMIEPTETESLETLDAFCDRMLHYAELAKSDPGELKRLDNLEVTHLDETMAARKLNPRWTRPESP
jgi:glycine dehydrogenase subunit 2